MIAKRGRISEILRSALESAQRRFRARRMRAFAEAFPIAPGTTILDVGGTPGLWVDSGIHARIVLANTLRARPEAEAPGFELVAADGCALPFPGQSFDIVFSNSVIEHVGDTEAQRRFADEARRVGRAYWIQTPNRNFPLETHLLTPFVHMLPKRMQRAVVTRFTVWSLLNRRPPDEKRWYIEHFLNDIRLLAEGDITDLFPEAVIRKERFLTLAKSLIATRGTLDRHWDGHDRSR